MIWGLETSLKAPRVASLRHSRGGVVRAARWASKAETSTLVSRTARRSDSGTGIAAGRGSELPGGRLLAQVPLQGQDCLAGLERQARVQTQGLGHHGALWPALL